MSRISKKTARKAGWLIRDVFDWGRNAVSALIIVVTVFTFAVRTSSVDGPSMLPTLKDEDQLIVTNFFYTPAHNDIVIIYAPNLYDSGKGEMGKSIIKRIIGVEGDTIRIDSCTGTVYRNDIELEITEEDKQLFEEGYRINSRTHAVDITEEVTVPPGYVFVMGDNRNYSMDSRYTNDGNHPIGYIGMINVNHIAGRAFFRVLPFDSFGFLT